MHEYSLVEALLRQVEQLREEQGARRVVAVNVSIGAFSGVEPELLRAAFQRLAEGRSELVIEVVPLQAGCTQCGLEFAVERFRFCCPHCAGRQLSIIRGEELMLESVVLEPCQNE